MLKAGAAMKATWTILAGVSVVGLLACEDRRHVLSIPDDPVDLHAELISVAPNSAVIVVQSPDGRNHVVNVDGATIGRRVATLVTKESYDRLAPGEVVEIWYGGSSETRDPGSEVEPRLTALGCMSLMPQIFGETLRLCSQPQWMCASFLESARALREAIAESQD